ncbi:hypothetical protein [Streptomyces nigrescens]|uniref:Uncharacterized protein n=1 Tax=Streptomyces nigrescens TaxID=1920 RepID=A0ABY7IXU2_STRNI|nr:hypothetical protein [Streptomyces nigrescens]WAU03809.1 hypothetical protein STRNI_001999 [Streptomyces nigrescens]
MDAEQDRMRRRPRLRQEGRGEPGSYEYIDGFYNSRRIQERLGFLSLIELEEQHCTDHATAEQAKLKPVNPP